jgi:glycosyltransferase involved in cell wall biosynthesis
MRIAILWTGLSGYLNACLKELAAREEVELLVCHSAPENNAPFDERQFAWIPNRIMWRSDRDLHPLEQRLRLFSPDILVHPGWFVRTYRRLAREYSNKCWRVMTMDNCWNGTFKQRAGTWISRCYLKPLADAVWLPGERQAIFARKLGFKQEAILRGLYACDQPAIEAAHIERVAEKRPLSRAFLFVGRFVLEKDLETLVKGYEVYRRTHASPWPLVCCGAGPLRHRLEGRPGIRVEGFIQPDRLGEVLSAAGALVLPSKFEPWAVVVHEAASAGLPIVASERVGAAVHLVQPGYNGFIFNSGDASGLATAMSRISDLSDVQLNEMSRASNALSKQFSPKRWADTLLESFCALTSVKPSPR